MDCRSHWRSLPVFFFYHVLSAPLRPTPIGLFEQFVQPFKNSLESRGTSFVQNGLDAFLLQWLSSIYRKLSLSLSCKYRVWKQWWTRHKISVHHSTYQCTLKPRYLVSKILSLPKITQEGTGKVEPLNHRLIRYFSRSLGDQHTCGIGTLTRWWHINQALFSPQLMCSRNQVLTACHWVLHYVHVS